MEGLVLFLPVLFLSICISFILIQSCYQRWKAGGIWKKKREAAKISLVNILQMTNPTLTSPWYNIDKISEKGTTGVTTEKTIATTKIAITKPKSGTDTFVFDPRNPNLLSSVIIMKEQDDNVPPPCYHCTNSSSRLSEALILRPPSYPSLYRCSSQTLTDSRENLIVKSSKEDECVCKTEKKDFLQPSEPSTERRNSSAVLYL